MAIQNEDRIVSITNIIFSYPTQAVSRTDIFVNACRELKKRYGYNAVLTYNGPLIKNTKGIDCEHFETWLFSNKDIVAKTSLIDLEKRYGKSNFWQAAVIERNLTDYSFTGNDFSASGYKISEIEWYLKALVLFYEYVIKKYSIQAAFNIVADNIHNRVIEELSKSLNIIPFAIGRGLYWFDDMFYLNTGLNFGSKLLEKRYQDVLNGNLSVLGPDLPMIEKHINEIREKTANSVKPNIIYSKSLTTILINAAKTAAENYRLVTIAKPSISESNYKYQFFTAVISLFRVARNIVWMRRNVIRRTLPTEPYVFLPLPYQPEATILGSSPGWLDQIGIIRLLSAALPSGFRLLVKDHPAIGGLRKPAFYKSIMELKNAILLDDRVEARSIINDPNCKLLATNGGTTGFEGMMFGKPLLIFGRAYYDCMKALIKPPADLNDMPVFMKEILLNEKRSSPEKVANDAKIFLTAWFSLMKPAGKAVPEASGNSLDIAKDWARVVDDLIKQITESNLYG